MDTGYNIYNTLAFAILLALFLIYAFPKLLKKVKIKIDRHFILAALPYAIFGAVLRYLNDLAQRGKGPEILSSSLFVSPTIWAIGFAIGIFALLISVFLREKFRIEYYKATVFIGILITLPLLFLIRISNFQALLYELALFTIISLPFYILHRIKKFKFEKKTMFYPMLGQILDGTATFSASVFWGRAFFEKHVIPRFFINNFGPLSFIILKIVVIFSILYYINEKLDKEEAIYYSAIVGYLGLITGIRDFLLLISF